MLAGHNDSHIPASLTDLTDPSQDPRMARLYREEWQPVSINGLQQIIGEGSKTGHWNTSRMLSCSPQPEVQTSSSRGAWGVLLVFTKSACISSPLTCPASTQSPRNSQQPEHPASRSSSVSQHITEDTDFCYTHHSNRMWTDKTLKNLRKYFRLLNIKGYCFFAKAVEITCCQRWGTLHDPSFVTANE